MSSVDSRSDDYYDDEEYHTSDEEPAELGTTAADQLQLMADKYLTGPRSLAIHEDATPHLTKARQKRAEQVHFLRVGVGT